MELTAVLKDWLKLVIGLTMLFALPPQIATASSSKSKPDCQTDKLYCTILELRPDINKDMAYSLSNHIYKYSNMYKVDPYRVIAIGMQESGLRVVNRKQSVMLINEECDPEGVCTEYAKYVTGYSDVGIFQFHVNTIQNYSMDALRLRDDIEYATEQACLLLSLKIKECKDVGKNAWACYHSRTEHHRKLYVKLVNRYYKNKDLIDGKD